MHNYDMRTTLDITDHLLVEAKKLAAEMHVPLRAVVEDALRLRLAQDRSKRAAKVDDRIPLCNAGKPLPGVDLNDTSALLEIE